MAKRRLDALLAERGLFSSRSRAAASVMAGEVHVGASRRRAAKPSELVDVGEELSVDERPRFVSRGGIKLANALDASRLDVRERRALDVGYGELAWSVRNDARVTVLERTNARELTPQMLPYAPDLAVIDVSFISLAKVLGPVLACLAPGWDALALVKPQFEVGRERVGRGGVVRDADVRRSALIDVGRAALSLGAAVVGYYSSGLPGPKGNRETFVWLTDPERAGERLAGRDVVLPGDAVADRASERLERLAREVEP
ncbi:MAG TPA: TlyA family RNA methyltransferase [Solirubrobacteraceae bacterium]